MSLVTTGHLITYNNTINNSGLTEFTKVSRLESRDFNSGVVDERRIIQCQTLSNPLESLLPRLVFFIQAITKF